MIVSCIFCHCCSSRESKECSLFSLDTAQETGDATSAGVGGGTLMCTPCGVGFAVRSKVLKGLSPSLIAFTILAPSVFCQLASAAILLSSSVFSSVLPIAS